MTNDYAIRLIPCLIDGSDWPHERICIKAINTVEITSIQLGKQKYWNTNVSNVLILMLFIYYLVMFYKNNKKI